MINLFGFYVVKVCLEVADLVVLFFLVLERKMRCWIAQLGFILPKAKKKSNMYIQYCTISRPISLPNVVSWFGLGVRSRASSRLAKLRSCENAKAILFS